MMFYQIFFSPQVKRSVIISNNHGIFELSHKLQNKNFRRWGGQSAHTRKKKDLGL